MLFSDRYLIKFGTFAMSVSSTKGLRLKFKTSTTTNPRTVVNSVPVCMIVSSSGNVTVDGSESSCVPCWDLDSASSLTEPDTSVQPLSKRQKTEQDWSEVMADLAAVGLKVEAPITNVCSLCTEVVTNPIRCLDCHRQFTCCEVCEQKVHNGRLHKPEIWQVWTGTLTLLAVNMYTDDSRK